MPLKPFVSDSDFVLFVDDALDVLRALPKEAAAAVVTSPPYLDARPEYPSPSLAHHEAIFAELTRVICEGGCLLYNVGRLFRNGCEQRWWVDLIAAAERAGWSHLDTRIWLKPNANPIHGTVFADSHEYVLVLGDPACARLNVDAIRTEYEPESIARMNRIWRRGRGTKGDDRDDQPSRPVNELGARGRSFHVAYVGRDKGNPHPAPMALETAEWMVALASWPGDTVLDPFAGSGTTAVAARRLGRKAVCIDVEADFASYSAHRLSQQSIFAEGSAA